MKPVQETDLSYSNVPLTACPKHVSYTFILNGNSCKISYILTRLLDKSKVT